MSMIRAVLFDLDGTLLDTAPDLSFALNQVREQHNMEPLPLAVIRPLAGYGSRAMLKLGFDIDENHPHYNGILESFLNAYHANLTRSTALFPDMEKVLRHLEERHIPWGIVTNKPSRFTYDLLKAMRLDHRAACIICGDSLSKRKPAPDQILHACDKLKLPVEDCVYVGDTEIDVIASKAAGTKSLVALYGYIGLTEHPQNWQADGYVNAPAEIIHWLQEYQTIE